MPEPNLPADLEELPGLDAGSRLSPDPERLRRTPQQSDVPGRIRSCYQHQALGGLRQLLDAPQKVLLELTRKTPRVGNWEATRQFRGGHTLRQFQQCQRISPCFSNDAVPDTGVDSTWGGRDEKTPGIVVGKAAQRQYGQPHEVAVLGGLAESEKHQHRLGEHPSPDKPENLARRGIQPLRVIDEAQQRTLQRHFSQQAQGR
jgi:hypothetical protein